MTSLADLAWPEVEHSAAGALLVVPIGATEQHGPHLPLSTDTDIAVALAEAIARERGAVVAPALAFGSSGEHAGFPGTLSIGPAATELLLVELVRSASATFARVVLLSAHGGNAECVSRAETRLREEQRDVRAFFPTWSGDAHAGRAETSLMLALAPERVRLDRAESGVTTALPEILPRLRDAGVRAVSKNGVLGDPAGASAEEGRQLLRSAVDELLCFVDDWRP